MILLPAGETVCREWCKIAVKLRVTGLQVQDTRLAAVMYVYGVRHIRTFNAGDFSRFDGLVAIHPESVWLPIQFRCLLRLRS
jgi:predicted nucleic acid-binding protein